MESVFDIESEFLSIKNQLKSYLYRLCANKPDSEDLLHDTYIKVKDNIGTFKGRSSFKTWVFTIATNLAKDNRRVKNRWALDAQDKCKEAAMANSENQQKMFNAFQSQIQKQFEIAEHINYCFTCIAKNLSLEQQVAIILKEFYQFASNEIANILSRSESVVKHLLHDARKELQAKYEYRCAMINKNGICYQCAELNDTLQGYSDSEQKIRSLQLSRDKKASENLDIRFAIINKINPLEGNSADLEDTIVQILRQAIDDK
jgi:RNA polymerase sigma-70 factor, ECF subfamily